jgi:hypothetical protein
MKQSKNVILPDLSAEQLMGGVGGGEGGQGITRWVGPEQTGYSPLSDP